MKKDTKALLLIYGISIFIRYWLMKSDYQKVIAERVEISTPLNSWKRVTEGLYLLRLGVDPYNGDTLHETPVHMFLYGLIMQCSGNGIICFFIFCDILTAFALYLIAKQYMQHLSDNQTENEANIAADAKNLMMDANDFLIPPLYVTAAYLFNPYCLFNCIGLTTTVFSNLLLAVAILGLTYGKLIVSTLALAICIAQSFYPIVLLAPLYLFFSKVHKSTKNGFLGVILTLLFLAIFLCANCYLCRSWNFLESTFGFILTVPELRPNIGLFWYFFIEMFEHFRTLFIYSFQINVSLLYLVPLSIRFRNDPMLLAASLISLIATFKSYPCLGDVGFVLALLPCWKHLFNYMQQGFLVGCNFLVTTALAPTVWHLWIYSKSANANFYFGVTLAFATAQIFLITDILFAYIKREFSLKYGRIRKINGQDAKLVLE